MLPRSGPALAVDVITTPAALDALDEEWRALHAHISDIDPGAVTPFQSPSWLLPWWRHFGATAGDLHVITLRHAGALVGVAPFFIHTGTDGARRLLLLGTGNTDHLGPSFAPEHARCCAELVARHCERAEGASGRASWDACDLQRLPRESALLNALGASCARARPQADEPSPELPLPTAGDALPGAIPQRLWKRYRYQRRRAERRGWRVVEAGKEIDAPALLDALVALHEARWAARGERGVLTGAATRAFHADVVRAWSRDGALRLHGVLAEGRVIAVLYGCADGTRVYYYLGGFDPAVEHWSLGTMLIGYAIEQGVAAGARAFDFLRGREPYKYRWGAVDRPLWRVTIPASRQGARWTIE